MNRVTVNTNLPPSVVEYLVGTFEDLHNRISDYSCGKPSEDDIEAAWDTFRNQLEDQILP